MIGKLIGKNNKGEIVEISTWCNDCELTQIIDISINSISLTCHNNQLITLPKLPKGLRILWCFNNKIKKLPKLSNNLIQVCCDIECLEDYMFKMKNTDFHFYC